MKQLFPDLPRIKSYLLVYTQSYVLHEWCSKISFQGKHHTTQTHLSWDNKKIYRGRAQATSHHLTYIQSRPLICIHDKKSAHSESNRSLKKNGNRWARIDWTEQITGRDEERRGSRNFKFRHGRSANPQRGAAPSCAALMS
jgi:hypothetical protein